MYYFVLDDLVTEVEYMDRPILCAAGSVLAKGGLTMKVQMPSPSD